MDRQKFHKKGNKSRDIDIEAEVGGGFWENGKITSRERIHKYVCSLG